MLTASYKLYNSAAARETAAGLLWVEKEAATWCSAMSTTGATMCCIYATRAAELKSRPVPATSGMPPELTEYA